MTAPSTLETPMTQKQTDLLYDVISDIVSGTRHSLPRARLLFTALLGTSLFNLGASIFSMPTMVHPHYMISHVILNEKIHEAAALVWTFCALVVVFSDWLLLKHFWQLGPPLRYHISLGFCCTIAACVGWIGAAIWNIYDHVVVHAIMGALYGGGYTFRAAIHTWLIDPVRVQHGLPSSPASITLRRGAVLMELLAAPVLLAGLPTLLMKDNNAWSDWSLQEQSLALMSSAVEHVVFVHLRLLCMGSFLPDLALLDRAHAEG